MYTLKSRHFINGNIFANIQLEFYSSYSKEIKDSFISENWLFIRERFVKNPFVKDTFFILNLKHKYFIWIDKEKNVHSSSEEALDLFMKDLDLRFSEVAINDCTSNN